MTLPAYNERTSFRRDTNLKSALLFAFVLAMPFQDVALSDTPLGFAGASLSVVPLGMLLLLQLAEWTLRKSHTINRKYFWAVVYMTVITTAYFASSGLVSHGENLLLKSIKLFLLTILFVSPIIYFCYEKFPAIKYAVCAAFAISCVGVLLSFLSPEWLDRNPMLHATENGNMKPRGFALESTTLSLQLVTLGLLTMHYFSSRALRASILAAMVVALLMIGSKGGVMVFGMAIFGTILLLTRMPRWKKMLGTVVGLLIALGALYFVADAVVQDLEEYTSAATRLTMTTTAVLVAIHNPLGVGFSGYLPAISTYLPEAIALFNLPLNYEEVSLYIAQDSSKNISAKTFVFQYMFFFGWPFFIAYVIFFVVLVRRIRQVASPYLLAAVLFALLAMSTYSDGVGLYNVSLVLGVAFGEAFRPNKFGNIPKRRRDAN